MNNKIKYIFIIFTVACVIFIWYHSSLDGKESSMESQGVLGIIEYVFDLLHIPTTVSEFALRKLAHFLEFSGLGFLLTCDIFLWSKQPIRNIHISPSIGILVACIDETIQIFSPGRSSKVTDVWVDFAGIIAATVVTIILKKIFFNNKLKSKHS